MSTVLHKQNYAQRRQAGSAATSEQTTLIGGLRFDWLLSLLSLVFVGGLYLDGWAHNHDKTDTSFFTIWHAFFYSGYLLIALVLVATLWVNHRRGATWAMALPVGYSLSLLGLLIFAVGGVGDMLWHEIFGVEQDFDALFSPTHLILGIGQALIVTGPLRAAWSRLDQRLSWRMAGPALLSLGTLISVLTFFMMAAHPLASNSAGAAHNFSSMVGEVAGVMSQLVTTTLFIGPLLLAVRRWQLPVGSLILVWGMNTVAMAVINWHHSYTLWQMLAMLGAVVVAEGLRLRLEPLMNNTAALRVFAALAPMLLVGSYFIALLATEGTSWSIHLWTGTVVECAIAGWLLSYLVVPPAVPLAEPDLE